MQRSPILTDSVLCYIACCKCTIASRDSRSARTERCQLPSHQLHSRRDIHTLFSSPNGYKRRTRRVVWHSSAAGLVVSELRQLRSNILSSERCAALLLLV